MTDYKEMYLTLFRATSKAIEYLQEAQLKTEEMYLSLHETDSTIVEDKPEAGEACFCPRP